MQFGRRIVTPDFKLERKDAVGFSVGACVGGTAACCIAYLGFSPVVLALEALVDGTVSSYNIRELILSMSRSLPGASILFIASLTIAQLILNKFNISSCTSFSGLSAVLGVFSFTTALTLLRGAVPGDPWMLILAGTATALGGLAMWVILYQRQLRQRRMP